MFVFLILSLRWNPTFNLCVPIAISRKDRFARLREETRNYIRRRIFGDTNRIVLSFRGKKRHLMRPISTAKKTRIGLTRLNLIAKYSNTVPLFCLLFGNFVGGKNSPYDPLFGVMLWGDVLGVVFGV